MFHSGVSMSATLWDVILIKVWSYYMVHLSATSLAKPGLRKWRSCCELNNFTTWQIHSGNDMWQVLDDHNDSLNINWPNLATPAIPTLWSSTSMALSYFTAPNTKRCKKKTCPQPNWWPQRLQYVLLSSDMHKRKPWINGLSSTPQPFLTYPNQNDTCLFLTRMALILGTVFAQYWCKKSCTVQAPNGAEFTHHVHIQMGLHENTQITWMIRSWKIRLTYL